jgi:hypothetical protein
MATMTEAEKTAMSEAEKLRTYLAALRTEMIHAGSATHEGEVRVEIARVEAELAEIEAEGE